MFTYMNHVKNHSFSKVGRGLVILGLESADKQSTSHTLRHSFAIHLLDDGVNIVQPIAQGAPMCHLFISN